MENRDQPIYNCLCPLIRLSWSICQGSILLSKYWLKVFSLKKFGLKTDFCLVYVNQPTDYSNHMLVLFFQPQNLNDNHNWMLINNWKMVLVYLMVTMERFQVKHSYTSSGELIITLSNLRDIGLLDQRFLEQMRCTRLFVICTLIFQYLPKKKISNHLISTQL